MVSQGTGNPTENCSPDHLPSILHGALVGAGSLWPMEPPDTIIFFGSTGCFEFEQWWVDFVSLWLINPKPSK